ncbi:YihY/virulence factor BrkB family protein, partial [Haloferax sp. AB510]|uniref:YihY/virulence factor BrkB family protein n=1 Tax=Haloferax sp. AB510 TaxID=2934172 RepID=UPI00209C584F
MTSLSEAYHGGRGGPSLRRLSLGFGGFLLGVLLVVAGIVVATTDVYTSGGATLGEARELGGILGGIGVPAVFLGVLAVLPASRRTRAASLIGASIAVLGVALFSHAYPCQWTGATCGAGLPDLTLETVGVYFFGTVTTFWCLFVGVANFKTRNDPGGTATVQVTKKGETRVVEVEKSGGGLGGIGFLGGTPDGDVQTQTNSAGATPNAGATDGGASTQDITPLDAEPSASSDGPDTADTAATGRSGVDTVQSSDSERSPAGAADH